MQETQRGASPDRVYKPPHRSNRFAVVVVVFACRSAPAPTVSPPPPPAPSVPQREIPIDGWGRLTGAPVATTAVHGGGTITGTVTDAKTGEPLVAATVIAMSSDPHVTESAITDDRGRYQIANLEPATYTVTFYYRDITLETSAIVTNDSRTTVNQEIDRSKAGTGEIIHVQGSRSTIFPLSTKP
jgi:hypothetical protein